MRWLLRPICWVMGHHYETQMHAIHAIDYYHVWCARCRLNLGYRSWP
jgi:hypothetical protein